MLSESEIWALVEELQGSVAAEIRVMLGETPFPKQHITPESRQRRIEALQKCAAEATSDTQRHDAWMQMHREQGWVYGPEYDPKRKTHPNMLPWEELPATVKSKARIFDSLAKFASRLVDRVQAQ